MLNNEHMQIKGILLPEIMYFSKFYLGSGIDLTGATRQDIGAPVQLGSDVLGSLMEKLQYAKSSACLLCRVQQ